MRQTKGGHGQTHHTLQTCQLRHWDCKNNELSALNLPFVLQNFPWHVTHCPVAPLDDGRVMQTAGKPKVDQLHVESIVHQHIVGFDVQVGKADGVNVLHCSCQLQQQQFCTWPRVLYAIVTIILQLVNLKIVTCHLVDRSIIILLLQLSLPIISKICSRFCQMNFIADPVENHAPVGRCVTQAPHQSHSIRSGSGAS